MVKKKEEDKKKWILLLLLLLLLLFGCPMPTSEANGNGDGSSSGGTSPDDSICSSTVWRTGTEENIGICSEKPCPIGLECIPNAENGMCECASEGSCAYRYTSWFLGWSCSGDCAAGSCEATVSPHDWLIPQCECVEPEPGPPVDCAGIKWVSEGSPDACLEGSCSMGECTPNAETGFCECVSPLQCAWHQIEGSWTCTGECASGNCMELGEGIGVLDECFCK